MNNKRFTKEDWYFAFMLFITIFLTIFYFTFLKEIAQGICYSTTCKFVKYILQMIFSYF